jgi:hypothetical protein
MMARHNTGAKELREAITGSADMPRALSKTDKAKLMKHDNPDDLAVYPEAMRCPECGNIDLWDDDVTVGCDRCGWIDQDEK